MSEKIEWIPTVDDMPKNFSAAKRVNINYCDEMKIASEKGPIDFNAIPVGARVRNVSFPDMLGTVRGYEWK